MEQTPAWADVVFPVVAFLLTIVGPALVALWVIFKVATDKKLYDAPAAPAPRTLDGAAPPAKTS